MRKDTVIFVGNIKGIDVFHFCLLDMRALNVEGCPYGKELWFPYEPGKLFQAVEQALVINGFAVNVTSIDYLRTCGEVKDYAVVFNTL